MLVVLVIAVCAALPAHAEQDLWAYILVGDGNEDVPLLGGTIAGVPQIHGAIEAAQRTMHLTTAERMKEALERGWSVPSTHIETHHAWGMSWSDFDETLRVFAQRGGADADDVYVFYYVGHGKRGQMLPFFLGRDSAPYTDLQRSAVGRNDGRWIVILECCNSGSAASSPGVRDVAWILSSVGDTSQTGWYVVGASLPSVLPFSAVLADAMETTFGGVGATFEEAMTLAVDRGSIRTAAQSVPAQLHVPEGQEGDDPLESTVALTSRFVHDLEFRTSLTDSAYEERTRGHVGYEDWIVEGGGAGTGTVTLQPEGIEFGSSLEFQYSHYSDGYHDTVSVEILIQGTFEIPAHTMQPQGLAITPRYQITIECTGENTHSGEKPSDADIRYHTGTFTGTVSHGTQELPIYGSAFVDIGWSKCGECSVSKPQLRFTLRLIAN